MWMGSIHMAQAFEFIIAVYDIDNVPSNYPI